MLRSSLRLLRAAGNDADKIESGKCLSIPEMMKSLLYSRISGTLSTFVPPHLHGSGTGEVPLYGTLVPYGVFDDAITIGLLKDSRHCKHIETMNLCSLAIFPYTIQSVKPSSLPLPRANIPGMLVRVEDNYVDTVREKYLSQHPGVSPYINDYLFFHLALNPTSELALFLPAKNSSEFVDPKDFIDASIDPLAIHQRKILEGMNSNHENDLKLLVKDYANIKANDAVMYFVDKYGFNILATSKESQDSSVTWNDIRMPFPFEVTTEEECKRVLREAIRNAGIR
jgi:hypothetical protein